MCKCKKSRKTIHYTDEDMKSDIEWLKSFGIDTAEARDFIVRLLGCY